MNEIEVIPDGTVTTPRGFVAGAVQVGVRTDWDKLDVALLYSEAPCAAAGVCTSNQLKAAPVLITQKHLADGRARAVVGNAGCANAAPGQQGLDNAVQMAQLAGRRLGIDAHEVVVASTGVIGVQLPMDRIARGIGQITLSPDGGVDLARAIMTTDTRKKHVAARCGGWSIGGAVKGVGMIHPNMATMLCFLTTDAAVAQPFLASALKQAVDASFNMIDVDSDTSTNDTAVILANGLAGGGAIDGGHPQAAAFVSALTLVCTHLAQLMVGDAEGGTKVIEARVEGAASEADARNVARGIVASLGVKTAVYGHDPNWGRILAAVGNAGAGFEPEKTALYLGSPDGKELCLYRQGAPLPYDAGEAKACFTPREVRFRLTLGLGDAVATAWGSDLTEAYVRLNSEYTT
ncbi:MAG: bifunctional glutamate N-acetyltransferase/amino-acid acetyltransferase ArgJ [Dehalococcoidia bacterium]|nr:bifunctional glutamate N-acetyltransferase/amino-acid acetyltransferase ArgJ [Dehalococcoidia bacterium]